MCVDLHWSKCKSGFDERALWFEKEHKDLAEISRWGDKEDYYKDHYVEMFKSFEDTCRDEGGRYVHYGEFVYLRIMQVCFCHGHCTIGGDPKPDPCLYGKEGVDGVGCLGDLKQNEEQCDHNYECLSGYCKSWTFGYEKKCKPQEN